MAALLPLLAATACSTAHYPVNAGFADLGAGVARDPVVIPVRAHTCAAPR